MGKKNELSRERYESEDSGLFTCSSYVGLFTVSSCSSITRRYGKPHDYDPTFKGPIKNRSCTDVPCCILFLEFIAGMGVIACFSFINGNPDTIIYPSDYKGNVCNRNQEVLGKPYSFYFDYLDCLDSSVILTLRCPSVQVCLAECPSETYSIYTKYAAYLYWPSPIPPGVIDWDDFICRYDINPEYEVQVNKRKIFDLLFVKDCAGYYVESIPIGGRCLPAILDIGESIEDGTPNGRNVTEDNISALKQLIDLILSSAQVANLVEDFHTTWPFLFGTLVFAMFVSLICRILLLRRATSIVWSIIGMLFGTITFGTYYTYDQWQCFETTRNECKPLDIRSSRILISIVSYELPMSGVIGGIVLLLVLILFTCIKLATALLKEANQVGVVIFSWCLLWSGVLFTLHLIFISFWAMVAVFLASCGESTYVVINAPYGSDLVNGSSCDMAEWKANQSYPALCAFQNYELPDYTIYLQVYMVLGLVWVVNFIKAIGEMTLAGAYATYYWSYEKPGVFQAVPLFSSFWRSIRYNLGSLAFGSVIIAIVQLIRVPLDYIQKKVKPKKNPITRFIFCSCKCIFWCMENFMTFINRNAYIEIAIYGYSFRTAAKEAFFLLMRNIFLVAVLNGITSFILFLLKFTIALGMSIGAFYFFSWSSTGPGHAFYGLADINYIWAPVFVTGLASYVVSANVFSLYGMVVDTLFLCFLEDLERNDGSADKPYYMPKSLMQILRKKIKKGKYKKKKDNDKKKKKKKSECEAESGIPEGEYKNTESDEKENHFRSSRSQLSSNRRANFKTESTNNVETSAPRKFGMMMEPLQQWPSHRTKLKKEQRTETELKPIIFIRPKFGNLARDENVIDKRSQGTSSSAASGKVCSGGRDDRQDNDILQAHSSDKLTIRHFNDIVNQLTPKSRYTLFCHLKMSEVEIEDARIGNDQEGFSLKQGTQILNYWRNMKPHEATFGAVLKALKRCNNNERRLNFHDMWITDGNKGYAEILEDEDITELATTLSPREMEDLYPQLDLEIDDIDKAIDGATAGAKTKALRVLTAWRKRDPDKATTTRLIKVLRERCNFTKDADALKEKWQSLNPRLKLNHKETVL